MFAGFVRPIRGPWLSSDLPSREYRRRLLCLMLGVLGLISFVFYVFPFSSTLYDPRANLAITVVTFALMPLAMKPRLFFPVIHTACSGIACFLLYISAHTGGIHSPLNVWFLIFPLPVMLLGGARAASLWLVVVSLCVLGLFIGSTSGAISYRLAISDSSYATWAWLNNLCALATLLAIISWYDTMRSRQYLALDIRNNDLREAHAALKQSQAHKEEFMAAVGHELRTPMNAILGLNSVLREHLKDDRSSVEVVDHIRRSTRQLLTIINNVLDFSQLHAGELALRPSWFDIRELVMDVVDNRQDQAQRCGVQLTWTCDAALPPGVYLDRVRLYQMVFNLVENAIRYGKGRPVSVHATREGASIRIEVRDHGPGVDPTLVATLFKRFEQPLVQDNPHGQGAGLGLSICERLATLQGGSIGVLTPPDGGACFWFELPLSDANTADPPSVQEERPPLPSNMRVLLVDDDEVNRVVGRLTILRHWPSASVSLASSAAEAMTMLESQAFDLVLVDMHMPDADGPELARRVRGADRADWRDMPIVALTGNSSDHDRRSCLQAGMQDVLVKPLDMQALVRTLQHRRGVAHER